VVVYLCAGAGVFVALELPNEKAEHAAFAAGTEEYNASVHELMLVLTPGEVYRLTHE
jgi:hypothetical protein